jgi:uncharacterized RDD family membrane protein YckC
VSDDATPPPGEEGPAFAAYWRRLAAFVIDGAIVVVVSSIVFAAMGGDLPRRGQAQSLGDARGLALTVLGIGLVYLGVLNGSPRGQTAGKTALRIRVRDAQTGGPIGLARGLLRFGIQWVLYQLLVVPAVVDGLWPIVDPNKQAWHDKAARSIVVEAIPGN